MDQEVAAPESAEPQHLATAPEQPETASAESAEVTKPDAEASSTDAEGTPKTFTQEELDALMGKRLARERRKWEREQQFKATTSVPAPQISSEPLSLDQFESPEAYAEALAERKAAEKLAQRQAHEQMAQTLEAFAEREEEVRGKYDDYDQVIRNPNLPITDVMARTIQASEVGPEVAYFLGTNPKEADRIARLPAFLQAKEIGRIEAKLIAEPPAKKTTSAPPPITPVTARSSPTVLDTTDPRSTKAMSTSEWIAAERARQMRKLQNQIR